LFIYKSTTSGLKVI